MARPEKQGLDYFSHDVNPTNDQRLEYIEAVHGILGYAIFYKLLEKIYANGYFLPWTQRDLALFSKRINVDNNQVNVIINDLLNEGLINREVYSKYGVFTSPGIQKRYFSSIDRRSKVSLIKEYLLITPIFKEKTVIVYINTVNVDMMQTLTPQNVDAGTQSKVKESKVKESIGDGVNVDINPAEISPPENPPFEETEKGQELTTPAFDEFGPGKNGNGQDEQTELNQIIEDLRKKHFSNDLEKAFNLFLRKYMPDKNTNYKALIHCFKSLQRKLGIKSDPDPVRDYFKYLESALIVENGKYNAVDYQESIKKKGMATSADLMRAIGMKAGGLPQ